MAGGYKQLSFTMEGPDADGIAASQTPSGASDLTLAGALTSGGTYTSSDGMGHQIEITAAADDSGRTFTVTGTDPDGNTQTESITGPNATTTNGSKFFKTVTSVAVDAATAGAITVGTLAAGSGVSATVPLNHKNSETSLGVTVTGTIDYTVDLTMDNPYLVASPSQNAVFVDHSVLADLTASTLSNLDKPAAAIRLTINSYSAGATAKFTIIDAVR